MKLEIFFWQSSSNSLECFYWKFCWSLQNRDKHNTHCCMLVSIMSRVILFTVVACKFYNQEKWKCWIFKYLSLEIPDIMANELSVLFTVMYIHCMQLTLCMSNVFLFFLVLQTNTSIHNQKNALFLCWSVSLKALWSVTMCNLATVYQICQSFYTE